MNGNSVYSIDGIISIAGEEVLDSTTYAPLSATQTGCTVSLYDDSDAASETPIGSITITYSSAEDIYTLSLSDISAALTSGNSYSGKISKSGMIDITINRFVIDDENTETKLSSILKSVRALQNTNVAGIRSSIGSLRNIIENVLNILRNEKSDKDKIKKDIREINTELKKRRK